MFDLPSAGDVQYQFPPIIVARCGSQIERDSSHPHALHLDTWVRSKSSKQFESLHNSYFVLSVRLLRSRKKCEELRSQKHSAHSSSSSLPNLSSNNSSLSLKWSATFSHTSCSRIDGRMTNLPSKGSKGRASMTFPRQDFKSTRFLSPCGHARI